MSGLVISFDFSQARTKRLCTPRDLRLPGALDDRLKGQRETLYPDVMRLYEMSA